MLNLIFSVACSGSIFLIFKWFNKKDVDVFYAIVFNYFVAMLVGGVALEFDFLPLKSLAPKSSFWLSLFTAGFLFIALFRLISDCAVKLGVAVSSVASKASMVLPVFILVLVYPDERFNWIKAIGLVIALAAVVFSAIGKNSGDAETSVVDRNLFWLPIIIFIGTGFLDFLLVSTERNVLENDAQSAVFTALGFGVAGVFGLIYTLVKGSVNKIFVKKNLIGGLVLGLVNYGSIYFLLGAFKSEVFQRSATIPLNNLGIIVFANIGALIVFSEKPNQFKLISVILAAVSILLMVFSD
jgi:drug/metabolite transporter (DMT)-like permease